MLNSELERKKRELAAEQARQQELVQKLQELQQNFIASNPEKKSDEARQARQEVRPGRRRRPPARDPALTGAHAPPCAMAQAKQRKAEIRARQKRRIKEQQRRADAERLELEEQVQAARKEADAREATVEAMRAQFERELRAARLEMRDLQAEFERERSELLDTIREQNREQNLILQALSQFVAPPEQSKARARSRHPDCDSRPSADSRSRRRCGSGPRLTTRPRSGRCRC